MTRDEWLQVDGFLDLKVSASSIAKRLGCTRAAVSKARLAAGLPKYLGKPVIRGDGERFRSIQEAIESVELCSGSSISAVLKGRNKTAGGYTWSYGEENG